MHIPPWWCVQICVQLQTQQALWCFNTQIMDALSELKDSTCCACLQMVYVVARTTATTADLCKRPCFNCQLGQSRQSDLCITSEWSVNHWWHLQQIIVSSEWHPFQFAVCNSWWTLIYSESFCCVLRRVWCSFIPRPLCVYMACSPKKDVLYFMKLHLVFLMLLVIVLWYSLMLPQQPKSGSPPFVL